MRTQVIHGAGVLALVALGISLNFELMPVRRAQFRPSGDEVPFTWHPSLYRILAVGQVPVATDWLLISFLTTQEWKHVAPGKRAKAYYDLDLATELDPAFFGLYTAGSQFLTVVRNDNEGALRIVERGERFRTERLASYPRSFRETHWKDAWRIPFIKAFIEMFELGDVPAAARSLSVIDQFPEAPEYLKSLSKHLLDPIERYDVGERILTQMVAAARQDAERDALRSRLDSLRVARELVRGNAAFHAYLAGKYGPKIDSSALAHTVLVRDFTEFLKKTRHAPFDSRGGKLFLSESGRIDSTTKRERVFGLD